MAKSRKTFQRLGVKEYERQNASAQRKIYTAIEEYKKLAEQAKTEAETEVTNEETVEQDVANI
jgi:hypothetical protein